MESCPICQNTQGNRVHRAREMMLGLREEFTYLECTVCGALALVDTPEDLSRYYPPDYYSLSRANQKQRPLQRWLKRQRAAYGLKGRNLVGKYLSRSYSLPEHYRWFRKMQVDFRTSILDVGCGNGWYLRKLSEEGFDNLLGVDPFVEKDLIFPDGVRVFKKELIDIEGSFDIIMLQHSLEHMSNPLEILAQVKRLLKPRGHALISTPMAQSFTWREYGVHWVALDAPRHLIIHTPNTMEIMAEETGLKMIETVFDGNEFGFLASEQYRRDIPLWSEFSYLKSLEKSPFTLEDIKYFRDKSQSLNQSGEGDTATFWLQAQ